MASSVCAKLAASISFVYFKFTGVQAATGGMVATYDFNQLPLFRQTSVSTKEQTFPICVSRY